MKTLTLKFREDVTSQRQDDILVHISRWKGVLKAWCLSPHSKHAKIRQMCMVSLEDGADVEGVLYELRQIEEVESADVPAERWMAGCVSEVCLT